MSDATIEWAFLGALAAWLIAICAVMFDWPGLLWRWKRRRRGGYLADRWRR